MQLPLVQEAEPVVWRPEGGSPVLSYSSLKKRSDGGLVLLIKFIASIVHIPGEF